MQYSKSIRPARLKISLFGCPYSVYSVRNYFPQLIIDIIIIQKWYRIRINFKNTNFNDFVFFCAEWICFSNFFNIHFSSLKNTFENIMNWLWNCVGKIFSYECNTWYFQYIKIMNIISFIIFKLFFNFMLHIEDSYWNKNILFVFLQES